MNDLISRQAAIDALAELARERFTIQDYFQIYLDALKDADIKVRQLPAAQPWPRWIPCAERKPTRNDHNDGMVLVCHPTGLIRFGAYIDGEWVTEEPIAWMPLPEPYEEEQDEQGAG